METEIKSRMIDIMETTAYQNRKNRNSIGECEIAQYRNSICRQSELA
jgi:hypothetical protein